MSFKTGDSVKVKNSLVTGVIQGAAVDEDSNFLLRVAFEDTEGQDQERFFKVEELDRA